MISRAASDPLWREIHDFSINDLESSFKFSDRLAHENGRSPESFIEGI